MYNYRIRDHKSYVGINLVPTTSIVGNLILFQYNLIIFRD